MRKPYYRKSRKGWYIQVADGDGKYKERFLAKEQDEAFTMWHQMQAMSKRLDQPDQMLVSDVISLFCDDLDNRQKLGQIAAATVQHTKDRLSFFITDGNGTQSVSEFRPYHVTDWLATKDTWNATTRYHAAAAIKAAFRWATLQGRIQSNPVRSLSVGKGEGRDFVIKIDTYQKLLDGASDPKFRRKHVLAFRLILMALRLSGCRPSEIANLRIEHIHGDRWLLPHHKTRRKTKRPRVVYPCACLETLVRIVTHGRSSGPVFMASPTESWTYSKMRRRFERLKKRVKVDPKCVLYSFRHSSMTDSIMAGVDVATVAELHGTSIRMIEAHYGHLAKHHEYMKKASDRVQEARLRSSLPPSDKGG